MSSLLLVKLISLPYQAIQFAGFSLSLALNLGLLLSPCAKGLRLCVLYLCESNLIFGKTYKAHQPSRYAKNIYN